MKLSFEQISLKISKLEIEVGSGITIKSEKKQSTNKYEILMRSIQPHAIYANHYTNSLWINSFNGFRPTARASGEFCCYH